MRDLNKKTATKHPVLAKYKSKRAFKNTPEPKGSITKNKALTNSLSFVVQKHQASHLHYDFRLEHKGILLSWAIPKGPSMDPEIKRLAMQVENHPLEYGKFQGIIPKGNYGAGKVEIWDSGNYAPLGATNRKESERIIASELRKGHLTFVLNGKKLRGEFALLKTAFRGENAWLLVKAKDKYAKRSKGYPAHAGKAGK